MISLASSLLAVGGAHTGVAQVNLLDVLDANGKLYYWSDRPSNAPVLLNGEIDPIDVGIPSDFVMSGASYAWSAPVYLIGSGSTDMNPFYGPNLSQTTLPFNLPAGAVVSGLYGVITGSVINQTSKDNGDGGFSGAGIGWSFGGNGSWYGPQWGPNQISSPRTFSGEFGSTTFSTTCFYGIGSVYGGATTSFNLTCRMLVVYSVPPSGNTVASDKLGVAAYGSGPYVPWLVGVPEWSFHRSLQSDSGEFVIQNLSGDTLSRDFEKIMRRSTLEGAMFAYRCWQADAEAPWMTVLGTLTVDDIGVDTVKLKTCPLIDEAATDTPCETYCETCQLDYGCIRCGATGKTECNYSRSTCQVPERFKGVVNHIEKNFGETVANTVLNVINRRRKI